MSLLFRTASAEQHARTTESWLEELNFYETEIGSCELSLEQFITKLHQDEKGITAEQFQNQFIRQREVINQLKFKIRQYVKALPTDPDRKLNERFTRHFERLSEEVNAFRKVFNETLLEFDDVLKHYS